MVVLGSAAVLAHQCYDHVYVTVLGPAGKTCDASVVATRGDDTVELNSCFHGALTEGTWTLRASAPGLGSTTTTVIVAPADHCTAHVQSVELTLAAPGGPFTSPLPAPAPALPTPVPAPTRAAPPPTPPQRDAGALPPPPPPPTTTTTAEDGGADAGAPTGRLPDAP